MSNASLAKILLAVCAAFILGISFPIAGQAQTNGGTHFDGAGSGGAHFGTARAGYYGGIYRRELERHVSSDYGAGSGWHGNFNRRYISARRLGSYGEWRQSYWPYWGWDMAASAAYDSYYYDSYYYDIGSNYEVPADAGAVAYCVQRFRSYDLISGTYLGRDGYRHPCP